MRKILNVFLVVMVALTSLPLSFTAVEAETSDSAQDVYELYPIPQHIRYLGDEFIIRKDVNIVTESQIDKETKARLEAVLELKNITPSYSEAIVSGKTNILLGIYGSEEYVDLQFDRELLSKSDLFSQIDAHVLSVKKDMITILGNDTDAVFYGLTSLYHVFQQMDSYTIKSFIVEDYADVISRGFIEGYYGEPWSTEDRVDLMKFGGYYKANSYFYAPKDDPKHNAKWRELYNEEELADMEKLAVAGNESKTRFVYAIHPFMNRVFRFDENYDEDFAVLTQKLQQMLDVGVRQFSILGDDAGVPGGDAQNYVRLLTDLTEWIVEKQADYPGLKKIIPFVPNDYMGWGDSQQIQTLKALPENIQIVMTGGKVWGEVSQKFTSTFTANAGRGPYMWINWPVTDNSKQHLIMGGGHKFLQPNVNPKDIEGIVLNPMQQSEPSKLSIFYGAAYSWNIWQDEAEALEAWENAFSYVDHNSAIETESSLALKELSKHMINQDMDGRVVALDESIDLAPKLNDFKAKLESKSLTDEDIDLLISEFEILVQAAQQYRNEPGNPKTRDQMIYWLNSWDDTNAAALSYLEATRAYLHENESSLLNLFSQGQANFAQSKTHGFSYIDHIEYAEVGVQHIVPFIETLERFLSEVIKDSVGLGDHIKIISNISHKPEGGNEALKKLIDTSDATYVYWKGYYPRANDYIGLEFKKEPETVRDIEILLGISETHHDTLYNARLEYTIDGENWIQIEDSVVSNQQTNRLYHQFETPMEIKGFRVVNTKDLDDKWFGMRALRYNIDEIEDTPEIIKSANWQIYQGQETNLTDQDPNTFVWYRTKPTEPKKDHALANEYLGVDLKDVKKIDSLSITVGHNDGDKLINYAIETSLDQETWTAIDGFENYRGKESGQDKHLIKLNGQKARYVRIRNLQDKHSWIKFTEFIVNEEVEDVKSTDHVYTNVEHDSLFSQVKDNKASLIVDELVLKENQYIGLKLNNIKLIKEIVVKDLSDALTLEVSKNGIIWEQYQDEKDADARYIRLLNKTSQTIPVQSGRIDVTIASIQKANFLETSIQRAANWSSEDVRLKHNGTHAFDGKVQTAMSVSGYPQKGDYIIFDLGQQREISSIKYIIDENNKNYIRNAIFELSEDLEAKEWQYLFEVGDGIENNKHDDTTAKDAAYLTHDSRNPGYMYAGADDLSAQGRYLRVRFTSTYDYRFVGFNEIEINGGEYVTQEIFRDVISSSKEKPYQLASHMFDGSLKTAYTPADSEGQFTYFISEPQDIKRIKLISTGKPSKAIVSAKLLVEQDVKSTEALPSEIELGTLSQTISEFEIPEGYLLESITVQWRQDIPSISQIITESSLSNSDKSELYQLLEREVEQEQWTKQSKENYQRAYELAKEIAENPYVSESMIKTAAADLKYAIESGKDKGDVKALEAILENQINNDERIYTTNSYTQYRSQIQQIVKLLEDKDNVDTKQVNEMLEAVNKAQDKLTYSTYHRELAELKIEVLSHLKINEQDYTEASVERYQSMIEEVENLITKDKDDASVQPQIFRDKRKELEKLELISVVLLKEKLEEFKAIDPQVYTEASYLRYQKAIKEAENLLIDGTDQTITKAINNIDTQRKALEKKESSLQIVVDDVLALKGDDYATKGYEDLIDFVQAIDVTVPEAEHAALIKQIEEKMDQLVKVKVLKDKLQEISTIDRDYYTNTTLKNLDIAMTKAQTVITEATSFSQVTNALTELDQALMQLDQKVDHDEYLSIVAEIKERNNQAYTLDSLKGYEIIVDRINEINVDDLSQTEWLTIVYDYKVAVDELIKRLDKEAYDRFINDYQKLEALEYTYESYQAYQKILTQLYSLDVENTSEFEFIALKNQLTSSELNLIKIEHNPEEVPSESEPENKEDAPIKEAPGKEPDKTENKETETNHKGDEKLPATGKTPVIGKTITATLFIGVGLVLLKSKRKQHRS